FDSGVSFMAEAIQSSEMDVSRLLHRLRDHFGQEPATLPVIQQDFAIYERANLQLAVQEIVEKPDSRSELVGIVVGDDYHEVTHSKLSRDSSARHFDEGPVEYIDVALAQGQNLACVKRGLYLFRDGNRPLSLLLTQDRYQHPPALRAEVMATDREHGEGF